MNSDAWKAELSKVEKDLEKAIDAILAGVAPLTLKEKIDGLEARKLELTGLLAEAPRDVPDLLPTASKVYARKVAKRKRPD